MEASGVVRRGVLRGHSGKRLPCGPGRVKAHRACRSGSTPIRRCTRARAGTDLRRAVVVLRRTGGGGPATAAISSARFIGDKPVVVVRDADGGINVLVNRCAHRGVRFCRTDFGTATEFMCPYHQWTYDLRGTLKAVPLRRGLRGQGGMPDGLPPRGARPAAPRGERAARRDLRLVRRPGGRRSRTISAPRCCRSSTASSTAAPLRVLGYMRQRIRSNWKLMFENIKDPYHASLLHVFLVTFGLFRADQPSAVTLDDTGRHAALISQPRRRRRPRRAPPR